MIPAVLRRRHFRTVLAATITSNAGTWLQVVASGWLMYELTRSPAAVGALTLVTRAPAFLLSPYAGQIADRFDRRRVGMLAFSAQALGAGGLALTSWTGHISPATLYALNLVIGCAYALGLPAMLALVPSLVERSLLAQAVSLNAAGVNVARLIGPAIGGAVLATFGATACFGLDALSFLAMVLALSRVPENRSPRTERGTGLREAAAYGWRDPAMRRLLLGMAIFTMLASPVQELAPVVAHQIGVGPRGLGFLLGAMGGGGLLGAWLLERLGAHGLARHRALPIANVSFAVGMALVAFAPALWLGMAAMLVSGVFWIWMFAGTNTAIQLRAPRRLLGRMLGLYQWSVVAPVATGSAVAGVLAEHIGITGALLSCAAILGSYGLWCLWRPVPEIDAPPDERVSASYP